MANRHFGKIGDVWKHLPLAEALSLLKPRRYWETHSGSAAYPLTHSPGRDYGAWHFHRHANASPAVESSAYAGLLREAFGVEPSYYPGSPLIAMRLLGPDPHSEFLFCDRDTHSLETIAHHAREFDIPPARLKTEDDDGVTAVARAAGGLSDIADTFVLIDPYDAFEPSAYGAAAPVDLFARLSAAGFPCMFWWGYQTRAEAQRSWERCNAALAEHAPAGASAHRLWGGDITLKSIDDPGAMSPGVFGCTVLCCNLSADVTLRCGDLGRGLEAVYHGAVTPDGRSGELEFREALGATSPH